MPAAIYIEVRCVSCDRIVLSEAWRPELAANLERWAAWLRGQIEEHEKNCGEPPSKQPVDYADLFRRASATLRASLGMPEVPPEEGPR